MSSGSGAAIAIRNAGSCGDMQKRRAKKTRYESRFEGLVGEERGGSGECEVDKDDNGGVMMITEHRMCMKLTKMGGGTAKTCCTAQW